jgi:hypothetical protein
LERTPATVTPLVGFIARQLFSEKVLREVSMAAELEAEQKLRRMRNKKSFQSASSSSSSSSSSGSTAAETAEEDDRTSSTGTSGSIREAEASDKTQTKAKRAYAANEWSWVGESTQQFERGDRCRVFFESLLRRNADTAPAVGERIDVGDFIYVNQAAVKNNDKIKATTVAATDDVDGKACHIYQITSMFEQQTRGKKGTMSLHARRLLKGRETVLQEVGGPEELFLSDICETFFVSNVVRKVTVKFMPPGSSEHPTYDDKGTYFYRFYADLDTAAYVDPLRRCSLFSHTDDLLFVACMLRTDSRTHASTKRHRKPKRRRRALQSTPSTSVTLASPRRCVHACVCTRFLRCGVWLSD